jgi:hypothetical protein
MSTRQPVSTRAVAVIVIGVALTAGVSADLTHHACTHAPPPVQRPEAGTPRASYCDAADHGAPWLAVLVAAVVATSALALCRRRGPRAVGLVTALLVLACVGLPIVAASLDAAHTV